MMIIGIDPGSIRTGYGIIKKDKNTLTHITHGTIIAKGDDIAARLHLIHEKLSDVIQQHQPQHMAIEEVFVKINVQSALKLGQARGVALMTAAKYGLSIAEYSARLIKKTATGFGAAEKDQVQFMVRAQLQLAATPQADAADALAIAICHAAHATLRHNQ